MTKKIKIVSFVAIIILVAVLGYVFWPSDVVDNEQDVNSGQVANTNTNGYPAENDEPELLTSDIDVSNWKNYKNEEYGFEIKIPINWEYEIDKSGFLKFRDRTKVVYYEGSEAYLMTLSIKEFDDSNKLEEYINNWKETKIKRNGWVKNIKINDLIAVQGSDYLGLSTIIRKGSGAYILTKGVFSPEYDSINEIYNAFLVAFNFTN